MAGFNVADTEAMVFKFAVFKGEDVDKLSHQEKVALGHIAERIMENRKAEDKRPTNNYLVINIDEPYVSEIIEIMKRHGHWG